jgi:hypothetical protein
MLFVSKTGTGAGTGPIVNAGVVQLVGIVGTAGAGVGGVLGTLTQIVVVTVFVTLLTISGRSNTSTHTSPFGTRVIAPLNPMTLKGLTLVIFDDTPTDANTLS